MKKLMMTGGWRVLCCLVAGGCLALSASAAKLGVTVNGVDVGEGSGTGWTYDERTHYVEIADPGSYVLSGSNTEGDVMFAINADAEVTLSNLCLKCTTEGECCVWATNGTAVALLLAGTNTLDACGGDVHMGEGLCIENDTHLTITNAIGFADADAVLIARGSWERAAIAVGRNGSEGERPFFEIAGGTVYANWVESPTHFSTGIGASTKTGRNGEADIVISGGRVFAKGGALEPGIGGADSEKEGAPDIRITGGYVEAVGGENAAGIGSGSGGKHGSVAVFGGTVRATGGKNAFDMITGPGDCGGGGFSVTGGSVLLTSGRTNPAPSNGTERVWCVTVGGLEGLVSLEGLDDYGTDDIVAVDGKICLWLPNGNHEFRVDGVDYCALVNGANTTAKPGKLIGVTVNGADVFFGSGAGWTYDETTHYVEIADPGSYVLSGSNTEGEVMFAIDADAEVTLSNLCLRCTTVGECCIWATNDVSVTLFLAGTNTLDASGEYYTSGMGEGLCIENGSHLAVTNAPGFADADAVLVAKGSYKRAAIAMGRDGPEGPSPVLEIAGGTVFADGGMFAAGIGGSSATGRDCSAEIIISGGWVHAKASYFSAGIGGCDEASAGDGVRVTITGGYVEGFGGQDGNGIGGGLESTIPVQIDISGGTVYAKRGERYKSDPNLAVDMGAGYGDSGENCAVRITGGSVALANGECRPAPRNGTGPVWCVTADVKGLKCEKIEGLGGYGTKDIVPIDGKVYLWLPTGYHEFYIDGVSYSVRVAGSNTAATRGKVTGVTINGTDVGYGSIEGWTYDFKKNCVRIKDPGSYVLSGTDKDGETMVGIVADASVTLSNLCLKCSENHECGIFVENNAKATLFLAGTNTLEASSRWGEGLCVENGAHLTITNAPGFVDANAVLIAKGSKDFAAIVVGWSAGAERNPYLGIAGGTVYANWVEEPPKGSAGIGTRYWADRNGEVNIVISGGHVFAKGGEGAPGIGGADSVDSGAPDIRIAGGYVEAVGGSGAAGIGGGREMKYGSVTVSGGTVRATGGDERASDMIAGAFAPGGGDFTVTGGSVCQTHPWAHATPSPSNGTARVWCVTVESEELRMKSEEFVEITGLEDYGTKDIVPIDGKVYLWLPNGIHGFKVGGIDYVAEVDNGDTAVVRGKVTGVTVNGADVGYKFSEDWRYDPGTRYVEIANSASYVLSGTNTAGEVMFAIDADAEVTLSNLCLKCPTYDACCIRATDNAEVTLFLAGENTLDASAGDEEYKGEGLCIEDGAHLTITNAPGFADADAVLIAKGSYLRAAIAVGRNEATGERPFFEIAGGTVYANWFGAPVWSPGIGASHTSDRVGEADIVISGGRVFARGGLYNSGIGAADQGSSGAPDIRITGGYVEAVGGKSAAGIGGASDGEYGSVTVSGGTVRATGGVGSSADMLSGWDNSGGGDFTVTGGSVWLARLGAVAPDPAPSNGTERVWCATVNVGDEGSGIRDQAVEISGLEGYGTDDIVPIDGKVYLWLPNGVHDFTVNGVRYLALANDANTTAIKIGGGGRGAWHAGDSVVAFVDDADGLFVMGEGPMDDFIGMDGAPWTDLAESITELTVKGNITSIGAAAFAGLTGLRKATIESDSLVSIGAFAFADCWSLAELTLPDGLKTIDESAFEYCFELEALKLPAKLEWIGERAFLYCWTLTEVDVPDSVVVIDDQAFAGCSWIERLRLGSGLLWVGESAFSDCTAIESIEIRAEEPPYVGEKAFYLVPASATLAVPAASADAYGASADWSRFDIVPASAEIPSNATDHSVVARPVLAARLASTEIAPLSDGTPAFEVVQDEEGVRVTVRLPKALPGILYRLLGSADVTFANPVEMVRGSTEGSDGLELSGVDPGGTCRFFKVTTEAGGAE